MPWHCVLIVAPSSVVNQWKGELDHWGHFSVGVLGGASKGGRPGSAAERAEQTLRDARMGAHEIVVCSYDTLRGRLKEALRGIRWRLVVLDEAHVVKTHGSAVRRTMMMAGGRILACLVID